MYSTIVALLLKTTWRLSERLLYNQGYKERPTWNLIVRVEKGVVRICTHSRGHRSGGGYHGLRDPPWGARILSHILGTPALGSNTRKTIPLSWFKNQWDLLEGCKKLRLHSSTTCTHACLLLVTAWRQQIRKCLGLWWFTRPPQCTPQPTLGACSTPLAPALLSIGHRLPLPKESEHI